LGNRDTARALQTSPDPQLVFRPLNYTLSFGSCIPLTTTWSGAVWSTGIGGPNWN